MHVALTSPFLLQLEPLLDLAKEHKEEYRSARPFPHVVLDDFLPLDVVEACVAEMPDIDASDIDISDLGNQRKWGTNDEALMGPTTRQVVAQLNGGVMIRFLVELTGISGLVSDPYLVGGGIHVLGSGGFLNVHADFNFHNEIKLDRRINVLLYLNPSWEEEWGGNLELWSADNSVCERRIVPTAGRCVIFNTTDVALHGNPQPVKNPNGVPRRSLAFYYYTAGRPKEERSVGHSTIYPDTGQSAKPSLAAHRAHLRNRLRQAAIRISPPIIVDAIRRRKRT